MLLSPPKDEEDDEDELVVLAPAAVLVLVLVLVLFDVSGIIVGASFSLSSQSPLLEEPVTMTGIAGSSRREKETRTARE